jgi:hypothetical protein
MSKLATSFLLLLLAGPAWAGPEEQACLAELAAARTYAATLPVGDLSRRFAETALNTAETELNAGEVEDCAPAIAHARWVVRTRPYVLRPGETLGASGRTH